MANSKRNNSWLLSSFDDDNIPTEIPSVKRKSSQFLETSRTPIIEKQEPHRDALPKQRNTSSLSALLATCEPRKPKELVVSRQKQQAIIDWLTCKVQKGQPAVLVLSGPSGCGKTMAIKLLAKENNFDVTEWITPIDQVDENNYVMKQVDKFQDFLIRATRYSSVLDSYSSRLLLVKDFPNVYYQDTESFFSLLEKYFEMGKEPIVFICTETGNSKLLQMLFPQNIREKFGIDLINVNPATQAAMKNALKRISNMLNITAGHIIYASEDKVNEILSNSIGDIRSALLNLIFISLKVPNKRLKHECSIREENVGLLHGVGRVINAKRIVDGDSWKFVHDPDETALLFQSQPTTFLNFVQENYLNTIRGIEEASAGANILSSADTLNTEWRDPNLTKLTLSYCTRGIMVINEKPVTGWNPVRKPRSDRIETRRCLATAEVRWYESVIKPKANQTELSCNEELEDIIE